MARQLWLLFSGTDSLWIAWVHAMLIKNKCFWLIRPGATSFWNQRKLLKLRPLFQSIIKFQIGNGQKVFFWHDYWHPKGSLLSTYFIKVLFTSGISFVAKVSQFIRGCQWCWPSVRSMEMLEIMSLADQILPSTSHDIVVWVPSKSGKFHLGSTWKSLRTPCSKVHWYPMIWFRGMLPRHAFICWLALLNGLSTQARQHKFDPSISPGYVFYGQVETRKHLFFSCSFSSNVWSIIAPKFCGISFTSWDQLVAWWQWSQKDISQEHTLKVSLAILCVSHMV